jgi:hypothetical protein
MVFCTLSIPEICFGTNCSARKEQGFHKVERFVKALPRRHPPGPFHASLEGEKRIFWGIHSGQATANTPNFHKQVFSENLLTKRWKSCLM